MGSTSYLTSTDLVLAVSAKGASLEEWSDEMREDGAWGDIACIGIASKMLNAYYLIYEKRGSEYAQVASVGSPTAQFLMRLELEGRCHYNVLLLKPGVHRHRPPPHPNPQPKPASKPAPAPKPAPKPTPPPAPKPAPKPAPSLPKPAAKPKPKAKPKPGGWEVVRGGARAKSIVDDVLGLDDSSYGALSDGRSDDEDSDFMIGDEDGKGSEAGRGDGSMDVDDDQVLPSSDVDNDVDDDHVASSSDDDDEPVAPRYTMVKDPRTKLARVARHPPFLNLERRSAAAAVEYRRQCFSESELMALGKFDCGCGLRGGGCYSFVIGKALLRPHDGVGALLRVRTKRYDTTHGDCFKDVRESLASGIKTEGVPAGCAYFEHQVIALVVCGAAFRAFHGYPRMTLDGIHKDAALHISATRWAVKRDVGGLPSKSCDRSEAHEFAREHIRTELLDLSEDQPNLAPYYDAEADVMKPVRHMDACVFVCGCCKDFYTVKDGATFSAGNDGEPVAGNDDAEPEPCAGFCRYSIYRMACEAECVKPMQCTAFRSLYYLVKDQEHVCFRRKKGVSSDCKTCDNCNCMISKRTSDRTDAEFHRAKRKLGRHIAVIRRMRGWERGLQFQSRRQMRQRDSNGLLHCIMDKAANHNTAVPFRWEPKGKKANKLQVAFAVMMHVLFGFGLVPVISLPWLKTKVDYNCTCYLLGLQIAYDETGFLPRHISEHFDGGDENVSLTSLGFWACLVEAGLFGTVLLSRMHVGHTHTACDGEVRVARACLCECES